MLGAFEVYILYLALNRHFKTKGYNFNKYNGRVNVKRETFLRRRDKGIFNRLRYKFKSERELKEFFISNLVYKNDFSIYNAFKAESFEIYEKWKIRNNDLESYYFKDLRFLAKQPIASQLISREGSLPDVMKYFIQNKICIETLVLLDVFFNFVSRNEDLYDDDQFKDLALKIKKYKTFLNLKINKLKLITKQTITK